MECDGIPMNTKLFPIREDHERDDSYRVVQISFGEGTENMKWQSGPQEEATPLTSNHLAEGKAVIEASSGSPDEALNVTQCGHEAPVKQSTLSFHSKVSNNPDAVISQTMDSNCTLAESSVKIEPFVETAPDDHLVSLLSSVSEEHTGSQAGEQIENPSESLPVNEADTVSAETCEDGKSGADEPFIQKELPMEVVRDEEPSADEPFIQSELPVEKAAPSEKKPDERAGPHPTLLRPEEAGETSNADDQKQEEFSGFAHSDPPRQGVLISLKSVNDTIPQKSQRNRKKQSEGDTAGSVSRPKKAEKKTAVKVPVPISSGILDEEEEEKRFTIDAFQISLKDEIKKDSSGKRKGRMPKISPQESVQNTETSHDSHKPTVQPVDSAGQQKQPAVLDATKPTADVPSKSPQKSKRREKSADESLENPHSSKKKIQPPNPKPSILSLFKPAENKKTLVTREYVNDKGEFISGDVYE